MNKFLIWLGKHPSQAGLAVVVAVLGLLWAVGTDVYQLINPGPIPKTEENTGRTADAAEKIVATLNEDRRSYVEKLSGSGYSLTTEDFFRAVRVRDLDAVKLFCSLDGVHLLERPEIFWSNDNQFSEQVLDILIDCNILDASNACVYEDGPMYHDFYNYYALSRACGESRSLEFKNKIQVLLDQKEAHRKNLCEEFAKSLEGVPSDRRVLMIFEQDSSLASMEMAPFSFSEGCKVLGYDFGMY